MADSNGKRESKSMRDRLSQWESSLAPLDETLRGEVMKLSTAAGHRPIPPHVSIMIIIIIIIIIIMYVH